MLPCKSLLTILQVSNSIKILKIYLAPKLLYFLKHPEAITFASQTDGPTIMQACTQTVDQIRHDMATQTDDEKVTDIQKVTITFE